jgi:hypothetical protein
MEWAERTLALAERLGLEITRGRALEVRGMSRCDLGDWGGLEDLRRAVDIAAGQGLGFETVRAYINLATFVHPMEGPAAALELYGRAHTLSELRGVPTFRMWARATALSPMFELGMWDDVLREGDEVLAWERAHGETQVGVMAMVRQADVLMYRGWEDRAGELVDLFLPRARDVADPQILFPALAIAALVHEGRGQLEEGARLMEEFDAVSRDRSPWVRTMFVQVAARLLAKAGRVERAASVLASADTATPRGRLSVVSGRAVLAEVVGDPADGVGFHREAAEGWGRYGFVLGRAGGLLGLGRCLLGLGRPEEAVAPLEEAQAIFRRLGAVRRRGEAERLLGLASTGAPADPGDLAP